jgi:hypothetical protein
VGGDWERGIQTRRRDPMNSVHLIGRLATDVDVEEVNGGSKVSSLILAVDRNAEEADFAILRQMLGGLVGPRASSDMRAV